jgi:hypothetical protein
MTSIPVTSLLLRSGNASDRPSGNIFVNGELAINFGAADPGLYFEDSAGGVIKIGPSSYGNNPPNATPVGLAGNSRGELWTDSNTAVYYLKVWNGTSWQKIGAAFADNAGSATVTIASGAIVANSALVASGAFGAILASGALGAILASGSLGSVRASGSIGAVLASGSLGSVLSSGTITATGIACSDIFNGSLTGTGPSGSLRYKTDNTGTPSGLYVAFAGGWALV